MHPYTCAYTYVFHVNTRRGLEDFHNIIKTVYGKRLSE